MMLTAVVTGAAGQDGSYLSELLLNDGYKVIELTVNEPESNSIGSIKFQNGVELKIENNKNLNKESLMRLQIEHTIKTHIEKREILRKKGIKVLTLFFENKKQQHNKKQKNNFLNKNKKEQQKRSQI